MKLFRQGCIAILVVIAMLLMTPAASAELTARPLSPSVVLVLKLVSQDRVQPTTGIVMSDDGLVLVPAEFVTADAEIIVLDGGTDIIKNGRPARVTTQASSTGWTLLSVPGLERPGVTFSQGPLSESMVLQLSAFPPAEYIANGLPPLWADVRLESGATEGTWSISPETPQPYVTGAILDDCGYLAGISLTSGLQNIKTDQKVNSLFADDLSTTLQQSSLNIPVQYCESNLPSEATQPQQDTENAQQPLPDNHSQADPNLVGPEVFNPPITRKRLNPFQGARPAPRQVEPPSLWDEVPLWLPLAGLLMFLVIAWKAWFYFRLRKQTPAAAGVSDLEFTQLPSYLDDAQATAGEIRSAPGKDEPMPDLAALPDGCNAVLRLEIHSDSTGIFRRHHAIDREQFDLVIGAKDAEINIELEGIGQRHARLIKDPSGLTLSDLGSGATTLVNGVPCQAGEIMYLDPDAIVRFGNVLIRFSVVSEAEANP